jgi:hypothetical protein
MFTANFMVTLLAASMSAPSSRFHVTDAADGRDARKK